MALAAGNEAKKQPTEWLRHRVAAMRQRVRIGIVIIAVAILCGILLLLFLGIKVDFALNDDLVVRLEPADQHFSAENQAAIPLNLSIATENFAQCRTTCSFTLTDLSDNRIFLAGEETVGHNGKMVRPFTLPPAGSGSGQTLYSFSAECSNIRTLLCQTDGKLRIASSLISVDYRLTPDEELAKSDSQPRLEAWLSQLGQADNLQEQDRLLLRRLPLVMERQQLERELNQLEL